MEHISSNEILGLFVSFYTMTNIKIVLFDSDFKKIIGYPETDCPFCSLMQLNELTKNKCLQSNNSSFIKAKSSHAISIYKCHAGLIEATSPVVDGQGITRGYLMFGQITSNTNKDEFRNSIRKYLDDNNIVYDKEDLSLFNIKYKTQKQIVASSKILEMCTMYLITKDLVKLQKQTFIQNLNEFIDLNLQNNLSIETLMRHFQLTRNALYNASKEYISIGIAEYIKLRRVEKAKQLLKDTNLKVIEISQKVGFADYNYFCRTFKHYVGISAKKFRKN